MVTHPAPWPPTYLDDMTRLARRPLPPLEFLDELFEIDETSPSGLRRIKTIGSTARKGDIVGSYVPKTRYWMVTITYNGEKHRYCAHRIIYAMATKKNIDNTSIDHIAGGENRNVMSNLREATHAGNMQNRSTSRTKYTGKYKGVYWQKKRKKWMVQVQANSRFIWVGRFDSEEEAARAYDEAVLLHHGEFAKPNGIGVYNDA